MIELINVNKEYKNCKALSCINLKLQEGLFYAITGESGSGKSTLLSIIGGLIFPTTGKVLFNSEDISNFNDKKMTFLRQNIISFVFQNYYLIPEYSVLENVEVPLFLKKEKNIKEKCISLIAKLGLKDKINEKVSNLSGGEQQRCAIARALVTHPKIIIADEPCGNLDSVKSDKIMQIFKELRNEGMTIIMVTHNIEASKLADRIITLKDGKIIKDENTI